MKKKLKFLLFLFCTTPALLNAEPVVVWTSVPTGCYLWNIFEAYQVDEEVWAIQLVGILPDIEYAPSTEVDFGCPAFFVTRVDNQYNAGNKLSVDDRIYSYSGDPVRAYNPDVGDGWICHNEYGWCWVKDYPWVWMWDEKKWFYMSSTGPFEIADSIGNSWWMWTEDRGWFWTAPDATVWQWSCDEGKWVLPK
jgi:hypothetical protein